jgi:hypothetical protein
MRYHDFVQDSARWEGFDLRDDDIVIATPPKCGTTWTQRLCSLVLGVEPSADRPLAIISPWLDMLTRPLDDVVADLDAQQHRRFIKTHTPMDGLPFDDRVTYLAVGRDPRDAAISWAHHLDNMVIDTFINVRIGAVGMDDLAEVMPDGPPDPPPDDPAERFRRWVDDEGGGGLRRLVHHLATFWEIRDRPNVHLFHYGDMKADLPLQVHRLAEAFGVDLSPADIDRIAEVATFDRMRADADSIVPNKDVDFWKDRTDFFHKGTSGQWRDILGPEDLDHYDRTLAELAPPDLVQWLHEGALTAGPAG